MHNSLVRPFQNNEEKMAQYVSGLPPEVREMMHPGMSIWTSGPQVTFPGVQQEVPLKDVKNISSIFIEFLDPNIHAYLRDRFITKSPLFDLAITDIQIQNSDLLACARPKTKFLRHGWYAIMVLDESKLQTRDIMNDPRGSFEPPRNYLSMMQPWNTAVPERDSRVYTYGFGLYPQTYQPSGIMNYSRVNTGIRLAMPQPQLRFCLYGKEFLQQMRKKRKQIFKRSCPLIDDLLQEIIELDEGMRPGVQDKFRYRVHVVYDESQEVSANDYSALVPSLPRSTGSIFDSPSYSHARTW